jgi:hypothetical protein
MACQYFRDDGGLAVDQRRGGEVGHFRPADHLEFGGSSGAKSTTTGVMQIGIGLDAKLKGRFSLRGEARDFWSGTPDVLVDIGKSRQHNYLVGGGVVWHFNK